MCVCVCYVCVYKSKDRFQEVFFFYFQLWVLGIKWVIKLEQQALFFFQEGFLCVSLAVL